MEFGNKSFCPFESQCKQGIINQDLEKANFLKHKLEEK